MKMNMIDKQRGMSLVELMIAVGLAGGLAVAGMTLFKNQTKSQKTIEQNYDATLVANEIRTILSDPQNCKDNFGGKAPTSSNLFGIVPGPPGIMTTKNGVSKRVYPPGGFLTGTKIKILSYDISTSYPDLVNGETMLTIRFERSDAGYKTEIARFIKLNYAVVSPATTIDSCTASVGGGGGAGGNLWKQVLSSPTKIYYDQGLVGVGTTTPEVSLDVAGWIKSFSVSNANHFYSDVFSDNALHTPAFYARRARGSKAAPAYPQAFDSLGVVTFRNHTSNGGADVNGVAAENHTASASGSYLIFRTTLNGTVTPADRMSISHAGNVGIGPIDPQRLLHVNGPMRLTPITLPTTNLAAGDFAVDVLDNTPKYYDGTSWIPAGGLIRYPQDSVTKASMAAGVEALINQDTLPMANYNNTAYGYRALRNLNSNTAVNNTAIGKDAAMNLTTGSNNVALGVAAGLNLGSGSYNVAVGNYTLAGPMDGSDYNVAVGHHALRNGTNGGDENVGLGKFTGYSLNQSGLPRGASGNVMAGFAAGYWITTGNDNVVIGNYPVAGSANNITTGDRNILIGKDVRAPNITGSDQLNIGNILFGTGLGQGTTAATGNFGIGITAPWGKFHSHSSTPNNELLLNSTAAALRIFNSGSGSNWIQSGLNFSNASASDLAFTNMGGTQTNMTIRGNGSIQFFYNLTATSAMRAPAFMYSSDERLKKEISTYDNALRKVLKLRGVIFTWSKDDQRDVGFIAQEVEEVEPRLVETNTEGRKFVKYGNIVAMIVEAVKDLNRSLQSLLDSDKEKKRELASLKQRLEQQRARRLAQKHALLQLKKSCQ